MDAADRSDPTLGLRHDRARPKVPLGDQDLTLASATSLLWRLLDDTSVAACRADCTEAEAQDAAEAAGWCRGVRKYHQTAEREQIEAERQRAAEDLRRTIRERTGGELAVALDPKRRHLCTDEVAMQCPMRPQWQCLRKRELEDGERRRAAAHSATTRGVPADIAEACAEGKLPRTEATRLAWQVNEGKLKFKRIVLYSSDETGDGIAAAGYFLYRRGSGRFISVPELMVSRHDNTLRQEVMQHEVLALGDIPPPPPRPVQAAGPVALLPPSDLPRPLLDLLEAAIERIVRVRGKLVLTTRAHSDDLLRQFGPRTQEAFRKWGVVHPIVPEKARP